MADAPVLVVNGREYAIPELDAFTLGELAEVEKITGQGYDMGREGALGTLAVIYVAIKRVDPRVTIEDVKALTQEDVEVVGAQADDPPSQGAPNASAPTSNEDSPRVSDEA